MRAVARITPELQAHRKDLTRRLNLECQTLKLKNSDPEAVDPER